MVAQPHVHSIRPSARLPAAGAAQTRVIDRQHEGKRRCFTVRNGPMDRPGFRLHAARHNERSIRTPRSPFEPSAVGPSRSRRGTEAAAPRQRSSLRGLGSLGGLRLGVDSRRPKNHVLQLRSRPPDDRAGNPTDPLQDVAVATEIAERSLERASRRGMARSSAGSSRTRRRKESSHGFSGCQ